ncbi:hypothetical protein M427DRAFT_27263 [Gonapodya prolifera JEL478]|uniref:Glyoxalase-like domain-containing protein n=1 Tax=Gonapodya prolifera (strain JEL478) TaxID=1344416 RepID=A0A139AY79_GONPJ|nr:hypothetical protein M427DRAFT_27263 [Gonapodya prolifera JEL478]|eukprot:KXS21657.1 hypothetical protein M427DRAFT_27263 [Gonapodya prolifera JEL478]
MSALIKLDKAIENYRKLGFNVIPGGDHTMEHPTYNALISFADGVYLELLAFRRPAPDHPWWNRTGLIDWAVLPADVESDVQAVNNEAKLKASSTPVYFPPVPGGRKTLQGVDVKWKTSRPTPDYEKFWFPFFCFDVTPRPVRVPSTPQETTHSNGALSVKRVSLLVRDLSETGVKFSLLFGPAGKVVDNERGVTVMTFSVGSHNTVVELLEPVSAELVEHVKKNGDGLYELILEGPSGQAPTVLDAALTGGARISIVPSSKL